MNATSLIVAIYMCFLTSASIAAPAPPQDAAIARYREYVAAIREGKVDQVLKFIEDVPETSKPVIVATVKQMIAVEALKKEMMAQFGAPKLDDDAWKTLGQLSDEQLQHLEAQVGGDIVGLTVNEPQGFAGWMVLRKGQWVVPAAQVLELESMPTFIEPPKNERDWRIKHQQGITTAAEAVLKRLRNKEFKDPAQMQKVLSEETSKNGGGADGEIGTN
jgi:hypothetical protein